MDNVQTHKSFRSGDIILRQGDHAGAAFLIEKGTVEILIDKSNGLVERMGVHGPGTIIGDMAFLENEPGIATIQALEDAELLEITQSDFSDRLKETDQTNRVTAQTVLSRYRTTLSRGEDEGDPHTDLPGTFDIENAFRNAIGTDQLSLHYQPVINLQTGHVDGFEALMRWKHPVHGAIPPSVFIPVAERSGLIIDASRWALREACRALIRMEIRVGLGRELFMSVNFSPADFAEENFLGQLYTILSETDVSPRQICLEITERLLVNQPENALETLSLCRKAGLRIAIDDFGTGNSSLSYLRHYPIDTLKIDGSFIGSMREDATSLGLVKSIIALGKNLDMTIIAEGVEHAEEAERLQRMGCRFAQGYYFSRPHPEREITEKLVEWRKEGWLH